MRKANNVETDFSRPIIEAAARIGKTVSARILFAYASAIDEIAVLQEAIEPPTRLVLVCRNIEDEHRATSADCEKLTVPSFNLTRMGQIKLATLIAFSQQTLAAGDVFVFLTGLTGHPIDMLVTMRVGKEYELFQSVDQAKLTEHIRRPVFERVLRLTLQLAHEGREGKPIGAIFVIGDHREVLKYCLESRINPFRGYIEKHRNILDETIQETVKEIAKLDGAFIIKGNGVILSGATTLRPPMPGDGLPDGLGSRHAACAAITAGTQCIAISLSESTGTVRVWRRGAMVTEIERATNFGFGAHSPVID